MALTKVSHLMITGTPVNIFDYGAVGDGVTDDTAAIQAALDYAHSIRGVVIIPSGTFLVSGTLTPLNAKIQGDGGKIKYTGSSHCLVAPSSIYNVEFEGPGRAIATSIAIRSDLGFKNRIVQCVFRDFGTGIHISGSGQKIQNCYLADCGTGVKVVKDPNDQPTTTFTSEKNWYELCDNGLWIDSTGALSGFIACTSIDDIFQFNTGSGLRLQSATFPISLINPYTEGNSVDPAHYAFNFINSSVAQIGGYKAPTDNEDNIDALTFYQKIANRGVQAYSEYRISNSNGSLNSLKFDPSTGFTELPSNPNTQRTAFVGGDYNNTNSARYDMFGGFGDNGFTYGNFVESERTVGIGTGVELHFGSIERGLPDVYNRRITMDFAGNFFPQDDNLRSLGTAGKKWSVVYAGSGTINTSDRNQKQDIRDISSVEKSVASAIKPLIKSFRFKDSFEEKGDAARIHFGVMAQDVADAFHAEGLDPNRYGVFCSDTWYEVDGSKFDKVSGEPYTSDSDGAVEITRLGVRYDELWAFIISTL